MLVGLIASLVVAIPLGRPLYERNPFIGVIAEPGPTSQWPQQSKSVQPALLTFVIGGVQAS